MTGADSGGMGGTDPHAGGRMVSAGPPVEDARLLVIGLHGRGGWPENIVEYLDGIGLSDAAVLAPAALYNSWWPESFLAPLSRNEPYLSGALKRVRDLVGELQERGIGQERISLCGFSQGACLALEAATRLGGRFHSVGALSGGLLGTREGGQFATSDLYGFAPKGFVYDTRLDGTPVFIGVHQQDMHIPVARVRESYDVMQALGADVEMMVYAGRGHGVTDNANDAMRKLLGVGTR